MELIFVAIILYCVGNVVSSFSSSAQAMFDYWKMKEVDDIDRMNGKDGEGK